MQAIIAGPEGPTLRDIPQPVPGPDDVLVRVRASALNRADLFMLKGAAHGSVGGLGAPLGVEWAGEVVETGSAVERWRVGDRVMAAGAGAFAEYAVGHSRRIYSIPENLSFEQAATLPVGLQTMHNAISTVGKLGAGQSVLIQGASTGMGLMGMQIAKVLGAGQVIGSSTSPERRARLAEFGADLVVDSGAPDWVDHVRSASGGAGVDLVVDHVAGPLMNATMQATRIGGRIVNVGRLAGNQGEFDFDLHSMRQIDYVGVTFRTRTAEQVEAIIELATQALMPALAEGRIHMPVDQVSPLQSFSGALDRMARNEHFGKILLVSP